MLHANELMVGDLVTFRDSLQDPEVLPIKIVELHGYDDAFLAQIGGCDTCDELEFDDDIVGIPLTPEILEKNGFVKNEKAKSRKAYTIIDGDVYISWWRNRANIVVSRRHIGLSSNHVNVDAKCVHELQHALRLCGIEKEITLYDMSAPNKIPEEK